MRSETITRKVETKFGSMYCHVSFTHHPGLAINEVRFSSPGKFSDTTLGEVLDALGEAATALVTELHPDSLKRAGT